MVNINIPLLFDISAGGIIYSEAVSAIDVFDSHLKFQLYGDSSAGLIDEFKKILTRHLPIDFNPKPWRWLDYSTIIMIDDITRNINNPDPKWCKAQSNGTKTKRALQNLYNGQLSTCLSPLPSY